MDLSVIIVNYQSARYTLQAVATALGQRVGSENGGLGAMEVLVIDNGSPPEDQTLLDRLPESVRLIRNDTNRGFAAAVNQGFRKARGDFLCLLNPDTHLFPDALQRLMEHLRLHPDVAACGPRAWVDEERTFLLPVVRAPSPASMILESLARLNYRVARRVFTPWYRRDLALWRTSIPMTVEMLSGACLMTRRTILEQVGEFDPTYALYYEDADWCRRARQHGYHLAYVPSAEIVHYHNQSAQTVAAQSRQWMKQSRNYYLRKQFGRCRTALCGALCAALGALARFWHPAPPRHLYRDLGSLQEPPRFGATHSVGKRQVLFEISRHWNFTLKAAAFRPTPELCIPAPVWKRLEPGRYYTRLVDLATSREEMIWSWKKV